MNKTIVWVSAAKNYSELITEKKTYLSNFGIGQIEEKLNPDTFIRVHRSSIINLKKVEAVFKYPSSYDVKMKNGDVVKVSRS